MGKYTGKSKRELIAELEARDRVEELKPPKCSLCGQHTNDIVDNLSIVVKASTDTVGKIVLENIHAHISYGTDNGNVCMDCFIAAIKSWLEERC